MKKLNQLLNNLPKNIFLTGVSTDVGKTYVMKLIIKEFQKNGINVAAYKPISSGHSEFDNKSDVNQILSALTNTQHYKDINTYTFTMPVSPHLASQIESNPIDVSKIDERLENLNNKYECVIIEGAGGWKVPYSSEGFISDWVTKNKFPVILVVDNKLGCINHALLSVESIVSSGNCLIGWFMNHTSEVDEIIADENIKFLEKHISAKFLGVIKFNQE